MSSAQRGSLKYVLGPIIGVLSFVVGYVVVYLWVGRDVEESLEPMEAILRLFEAEPIGTWRVVGWLFYGAHFVETRISAQFGPIETTTYVDLISEGSGNLELLYLVPPMLLIIGGFLTVMILGINEIAEGVIFGASITAGYLIVLAVGLVLFAYGDTRPDPVYALIIAGILYPAVFGAVGGLLGTMFKNFR